MQSFFSVKYSQSKQILQQNEVREYFFVFSLLLTSLFVKMLKELTGVQGPKIPDSFKFSQNLR
jgi:hypothetical protein